MRATRLDDLAIIPNRAAGYDRSDADGLKNAPPLDTSCRVPAGGFVSTAEDLERFTIALTDGVLVDTAGARDDALAPYPGDHRPHLDGLTELARTIAEAATERP